nr:TetR/AcrR family transcriptional regulator [Nocardioides flavescens]
MGVHPHSRRRRFDTQEYPVRHSILNPVTTRPVRRPSRAEVRRQLLDAAATVFARRGIDAASLDEVAEAAGFTKGAVYSNFGSKDALVDALVDDRTSAYVDIGLESVAGVDGDLDEKARLLGEALTRAGDEQREWQLLFLELWQREIRTPSPDGSLRAHRAELRTRIADAVRAHTGSGPSVGLDPDELATVLMALTNGLAIERLLSPDDVPDDLMGRVLSALISR